MQTGIKDIGLNSTSFAWLYGAMLQIKNDRDIKWVEFKND